MAQSFTVNISDEYCLGMNDKYNGSDLPNGVYSLIENGVVDTNNISKRPGTAVSSVVVSSGVFLGGTAFQPSGGSKFQIVCLNGASNARLYSSTNGSSFAAIGTANLTNNAQMNFVQASDKLFGFNGSEVVMVASDGTTVTKNPSTIPIGKFGWWLNNYLFVAGVSATPNRLFWSNLGDPTTFSGANFVDINANDGDFITGLSSFFSNEDNLIVAKNNGLYTVSGFSGTTFSATTIAGQNTGSLVYGFGTPSHRGMVSAGTYFYYLSFVGGIPHIRRLQRSFYGIILDAGIISFDMEGTMKTLNNTKLSGVAGLYDGKYLYFSLPSSSSNVNDTTLVYYPDLNRQSPLGGLHSWVKWTGFKVNNFFLSGISGQAKIYFTDGDSTGKVFHFDTSIYTDNGSAFTLTIKTRDFLGNPAKKTKFKYIYFKYGTGSAGSLNIYARLDEAVDFNLQQTLSLQGNSPGLGMFILGSSTLGGSTIGENRTTLQSFTGHMLGVELRESTANACNIYDLQVLGYLKGYRNS